jgi:general secretion pathway protein L
MAEILLLRLPRTGADPAQASWLVCNATGAVVEDVREGPLEAAAALARGRRVVALVPGSDVLQVEAELPKLSGPKLLQAVPFAVEEQLADDVEGLHFALAPRAQGGRTRVTVVSRTLMDAWTAALASAGIEADALVAESALVPTLPAQVVALLDGDDVHASLPDGRRVTLPAGGIGESLAAALAESGGNDPGNDTTDADAPLASIGVGVYADAADWSRHAAEFEPLRAQLAQFKVQLLPQGPLPWFGRQATDGDAVNLLQGAYERRRSIGGGLARWRVAAALVGALLVLHVGTQAWRLTRVARAERAIDAAIVETARPVLGADARAGDARRRIQQQLDRTRTGASDAFLPALQAVAQARSAVPGARIDGLGFTREGLELRVVAGSPDALERMRAALEGSGYSAQLQGGTSEGDRYSGRIRLRGAGSGT